MARFGLTRNRLGEANKILNFLKKFVNSAAQSLVNLDNIFESNASFTAFHETDEIGRQTRLVAQFFLGPAVFFTDFSNILPKFKNDFLI